MLFHAMQEFRNSLFALQPSRVNVQPCEPRFLIPPHPRPSALLLFPSVSPFFLLHVPASSHPSGCMAHAFRIEIHLSAIKARVYSFFYQPYQCLPKASYEEETPTTRAPTLCSVGTADSGNTSQLHFFFRSRLRTQRDRCLIRINRRTVEPSLISKVTSCEVLSSSRALPPGPPVHLSRSLG